VTLVEVVAGLTLLASLGAAVVVAFGAHRRQLHLAQNRLIAAEAADQLLAMWYSADQPIPRDASGFVPVGNESWIWRTRRINRPQRVGPVTAEIVRLEVLPSFTSDGSQRPLASVELLVPPPPSTAPNDN